MVCRDERWSFTECLVQALSPVILYSVVTLITLWLQVPTEQVTAVTAEAGQQLINFRAEWVFSQRRGQWGLSG